MSSAKPSPNFSSPTTSTGPTTQGNGRIERSFRTDDDELYHVQQLPADFGGLETTLLAWNHVYETRRPQQALGYLTPGQFYQQWSAANQQRKEAASDMS